MSTFRNNIGTFRRGLPALLAVVVTTVALSAGGAWTSGRIRGTRA
jgi:hypothetical protein